MKKSKCHRAEAVVVSSVWVMPADIERGDGINGNSEEVESYARGMMKNLLVITSLRSGEDKSVRLIQTLLSGVHCALCTVHGSGASVGLEDVGPPTWLLG